MSRGTAVFSGPTPSIDAASKHLHEGDSTTAGWVQNTAVRARPSPTHAEATNISLASNAAVTADSHRRIRLRADRRPDWQVQHLIAIHDIAARASVNQPAAALDKQLRLAEIKRLSDCFAPW